MAEEAKTYLEKDVNQHVEAEVDRTGNSKSKVINDRVRDSYETPDNSATDFYAAFGQSLFVAGSVIGIYEGLFLALSIAFLGLGLLFWSKMAPHLHNGDSIGRAFRRTLGI